MGIELSEHEKQIADAAYWEERTKPVHYSACVHAACAAVLAHAQHDAPEQGRALSEASSEAYLKYSGQARRSECLGWKQKVESGVFGKKELEAHVELGRLLGKHQAFAEAAAHAQRPAPATEAPAPAEARKDYYSWEEINSAIQGVNKVAGDIEYVNTFLKDVLARLKGEK